MTRASVDVVERLLTPEGLEDAPSKLPESQAAANALARALALELPPAFGRYVALTGGAPRFLQGTDCNASVLAARTAAARALLGENGLALPADAIVIAMHQGYDVTWILAGRGDASPVFGYSEGDEEISERFASFTDWLAWAIQH